MSSSARTRRLVQWIDRQPGWRVRKGRGGHYKCYAPDGESIVTVSASPHVYRRAWPNMVGQFRRLGLRIPTF